MLSSNAKRGIPGGDFGALGAAGPRGARAGVVAHAIMELDNAEAAKKMVEEGLGVALLPRVAVAREIGTRQLAQIEIADEPPIERWVDAIRRRDAGPASGILAAFLAELQSTLRNQQRRDVAQIAI